MWLNMKDILLLFKDLKLEFIKIILLNAFLNSIIMFLATFAVLTVFDANYIYSLIIPAAYFLVYFIYKLSQIRLIFVEERNPQVKEMLRTAHDYKYEETVMSQGLFRDLFGRMKSVRSSTFLDPRKIFLKVSAVVVLAYLIVFVSALGIYFGSLPKFDKNLLDSIKLPDFISFTKPGEKDKALTDFTNNSEDIYGEAEDLKLTGENLNLEIKSVKSSIDISSVQKDDTQGDFSQGSYDVDVGDLGAQDAYTNDVSREYRDLVKTYFKKLAEDDTGQG